MMRSFIDFWKRGPKGEAPEPDLFDYAKRHGDLRELPERDEERSNGRLLIALLLSLYPLFFAAGYFTHRETSECPDESQTGTEGEIAEEATVHPLTEQERRLIGTYDALVSGHEADLYLYEMKRGGLGGAIRFRRWGKRELEYLHSVRVVQNRIDFIRSCRGEACARIGSPSPIHQIYSGTLSGDGTRIEGTYTGGQSASGWKATRIQ
jgi:hypothetical protein